MIRYLSFCKWLQELISILLPPASELSQELLNKMGSFEKALAFEAEFANQVQASWRVVKGGCGHTRERCRCDFNDELLAYVVVAHNHDERSRSS